VRTTAADTTLSRIVRMVERARARAPSEQFVERSRASTPVMLLVALLVFLVPRYGTRNVVELVITRHGDPSHFMPCAW
jgi:cation transport ATPase